MEVVPPSNEVVQTLCIMEMEEKEVVPPSNEVVQTPRWEVSSPCKMKVVEGNPQYELKAPHIQMEVQCDNDEKESWQGSWTCKKNNMEEVTFGHPGHTRTWDCNLKLTGDYSFPQTGDGRV
ncbi:hypothetical protein SELMODRAFT_421787 [Selaginella moellendorffii]|uniref:Uncharacterized protein n=1 Tax=Selaginella moellendorffii TaxID=88036 RepID=D8SGC8_SELML|nr:hypothetical protein SELMODRAFT_421787 [Selaginella moellendorffii]